MNQENTPQAVRVDTSLTDSYAPTKPDTLTADLAALRQAVEGAKGHPFIPVPAVAVLVTVERAIVNLAERVRSCPCQDCGNLQGAALGGTDSGAEG